MNSKGSKTSKLHVLILNVTNKMNLQRDEKSVIFAFTMRGKT